MTAPGSALEDFFTTTVQVQTWSPGDSFGPGYADAVADTVFVDDDRKLVRNEAGDEVVSSTTLYAHPDKVALYTVGSKVTVNGRAAKVLGAHQRVHPLSPDMNHLEIVLT